MSAIDIKKLAVVIVENKEEIKKRYNYQIKAFVSKINASVRACEKAKTYEDIDWETLIRTNELNKLYVSQLDLYLLANLGLSKKNCDEKGFTKTKKNRRNQKTLLLQHRNEILLFQDCM